MIKDALAALRRAERPVIIYGAGIRLAGAIDEARELARFLGVPVAVTWGARDLFPAGGPVLCVGGFGTHGTRAANFAVQNADWILAVGTRLDSKATGTPREYFARGADIFMADIDAAEVRKFGGLLGRTFTGVQADAKMLLSDLISLVRAEGLNQMSGLAPLFPDFPGWRNRCRDWLACYPACRPEYDAESGINPYVLMRELSARLDDGDLIVSDTGLSLAWLMQGFDFKPGQQFVHALNQTPMGYGLPAAIGAAFARPGRRVVLVTGDGGFMLNLQELPMLARHELPVKIVLLNNDGHGMCRQTQEQWLGGKYYSTSTDDLALPDFCAVARGFEVRSNFQDRRSGLCGALTRLFQHDDPALLDVRISPDARLIPQVAFGKPNEDGNPPLPREELAEQMIVGAIE